MEPPTSLTPLAISGEKNKVFCSMRPIQPADAVRGQYIGYLDEPGVAPHSDTETDVQRLIYDAMTGDHTLFTTAEGIERLWEVSTALLDDPPPVRPLVPRFVGPEPSTS